MIAKEAEKFAARAVIKLAEARAQLAAQGAPNNNVLVIIVDLLELVLALLNPPAPPSPPAPAA